MDDYNIYYFWINTFDIGLGNGMRNYLTKAISENDFTLGGKYISTTFILLTLIAIGIGLLLLVPLLTLDFNKFLTQELLAILIYKRQ